MANTKHNNYLQVAEWVHCLRCHNTHHREDMMLHWTKTCKFMHNQPTPCLCVLPPHDYIPPREGLTWDE